MSTHPNVILLLELTPDDLARKTYRNILAEFEAEEEEGSGTIKIDGFDYTVQVMESDYDKGYQISAKEGSIILHDYLTYGYGERVDWWETVKRKDALEKWAVEVCQRHHCSYKIFVTANDW